MISGIDISHYQSDDGVTPKRYFDPNVAKTKDIKFAFLKASELQWDGSKHFYKDPAIEVFARSFADAGIPFGCYHFARPSVYGHNPAQQAEAFWEIIKDFDTSLPPVLDVEKQGVGLSYIKSFMETIKGLSGKTPILYTSPGFWTSLDKHEYAYWVKEYPLWIAQYFSSLYFPTYAIPDNVTNSTTLPRVPAPFDKWTFWQYAQTGDGEFYGGNYASWTNETGLDLNVYNGTQEEFEQEFGLVEAPEPPVEKEYVRIKKFNLFTRSFLLFRATPNDYEDNAIFALGDGAVLEVAGQVIEDGEYRWLPVKYPSRYGDGIGYISAKEKYIELVV
jgi:GH25 family lysozyme M1 (1,4-beta-N-acetylmuramidase)